MQLENCVSSSTGFVECRCKDGYSGNPCVGPGLKNKNFNHLSEAEF